MPRRRRLRRASPNRGNMRKGWKGATNQPRLAILHSWVPMRRAGVVQPISPTRKGNLRRILAGFSRPRLPVQPPPSQPSIRSSPRLASKSESSASLRAKQTSASYPNAGPMPLRLRSKDKLRKDGQRKSEPRLPDSKKPTAANAKLCLQRKPARKPKTDVARRLKCELAPMPRRASARKLKRRHVLKRKLTPGPERCRPTLPASKLPASKRPTRCPAQLRRRLSQLHNRLLYLGKPSIATL